MAGMMMAMLGGGGALVALNTTLTIGTATAAAGVSVRGFSSLALPAYSPTTFGSLGSATLSDGRTCVSVYDDRDINIPTYAPVLSISGFASDPGQGYLYDVTSNGITKLGSNASAYFYSSGRATWEWEGITTAVLFGFGLSGSTSLVIRIA